MCKFSTLCRPELSQNNSIVYIHIYKTHAQNILDYYINGYYICTLYLDLDSKIGKIDISHIQKGIADCIMYTCVVLILRWFKFTIPSTIHYVVQICNTSLYSGPIRQWQQDKY